MRYYISILSSALGAGFLAAETRIFSASTAVTLSFAVGIALVVLALATLASTSGRGRAPRTLAVLAGVVAGWTVVESLLFPAATVTWLSLGSGGAILALSLVGLVMHELSTERVVHSLEVHEHTPGDSKPGAPIRTAA